MPRDASTNASTNGRATTKPSAELAAEFSDLRSQLHDDVYWLADAEREGRGLGSSGLEQAAQYGAKRFAAIGLEPAGTSGYFQPFTLDGGKELVDADTHLAFGDTDLTLGDDFMPYGWSTPKAFDGELAFGGYSVVSEPRHYDDYADIDVKGKVVLTLRYEPHDDAGGSRFLSKNEQKQMGRKFSREAELFRKARSAEQAGASALLIVNPPNYHDDVDPVDRFSAFAGRARVRIPVMQISPAVAERLVAAAHLPDLETLQEKIDRTGKPNSMTGEAVNIHGDWETRQREITTKNVVALFPGSGPLADEYVVVGGHYDHLGHGEYGSRTGHHTIHFGADDNASGTATVMALAKLLTEQHDPTGRSVLFVLFTAEEIGLVGSQKFVEHLPVEKDQVVAMLNYDMLGRPKDRVMQVGGTKSAKSFKSIVTHAAESAGLEWTGVGAALDGRSDHASFDAVGIPALFFFGSLHEDYHTERDTPDKVDYDFLAHATYSGFEILQRLRTDPQRPSYRSAEQRHAEAEPDEHGVKLSMTVDDVEAH